ncbi:SDR family NAD(P)-dependent oxidoreductase [Streptomyces cupreus]|uniref:SDR family oxidoreductase n=1 Tax=Streptomyces cupreus TaxID=2759956 RepID=A0A7X1MCB3_9ACTN|nr:SDR family oxidoreductase [Streptomyces cupreus]MBC2906279.1 SDR family oxidoreductase [Streptomyces cupreus]
MSTQRVALVTGSTSGIGEATAKTLAAAGYRVAVNSRNSPKEGKELADSLPGAVYVQGDIAVEEQADRIVSTVVERLGRLDLLVNNAGATRLIPHADLAAATPAVWREILDVNVVGTWQMSVAAMPHLQADGGGAIVNISSIAGVKPTGSSIPYAVSKAAINHLTRLLANVAGPDVRVNAVAPGLIDTSWTADFTGPREAVTAGAPLRRIGTTEDVAQAVLTLAEAAYSTGVVLLVDGGIHNL